MSLAIRNSGFVIKCELVVLLVCLFAYVLVCVIHHGDDKEME